MKIGVGQAVGSKAFAPGHRHLPPELL